MNQNTPSFVYIRFGTLAQIDQEKYNTANNKHIGKTEHGQTFFYIKDFIDYVDVINKCSNEEYENAIILESKIPYASFQNALKESNCVKKVSDNFKKEIADETVQNTTLLIKYI